MPITSPTAENCREIVLPEHLQLLLACLFLAFLLCIPIIAYTNHLKQAAAMLAPVPYSQSSAAETITPLEISGPGPIEGAGSTVQVQNAGLLLNETPNQSARVAPNRKSALDGRGGDELASQKTGTSKRILHKQISPLATSGRSATPTPSRTWSRNDSPKHVKAALIAIWHQTLKRPQNNKIKSSRSSPIHITDVIRRQLVVRDHE
jgi:hypothetical protein